MKKIAFFDFDGTITFSDSTKLFYKYVLKKGFFFNYYLRFFFPILLLKFRFIDYYDLKLKRLKFLTNKFSKSSLQKYADEFYNQILKFDLKKDAIVKINLLKSNGFEVVVVSASMDILLNSFVKEFNLKLITNNLQSKSGKFSGLFDNNFDCNFEHKVYLIKKHYNLNNYKEIHAYGDSKGDLLMLEVAHKSYYNFFEK